MDHFFLLRFSFFFCAETIIYGLPHNHNVPKADITMHIYRDRNCIKTKANPLIIFFAVFMLLHVFVTVSLCCFFFGFFLYFFYSLFCLFWTFSVCAAPLLFSLSAWIFSCIVICVEFCTFLWLQTERKEQKSNKRTVR